MTLCQTKQKDILDIQRLKIFFIHDSRALHPVQSSVRSTLRVARTFIFILGQLRSIERFKTVETVGTVETVETFGTVQTVEIKSLEHSKLSPDGIGWDGIGLDGYHRSYVV